MKSGVLRVECGAADLIRVGRILTTHGLKGQVKVEVISDYPQRFSPKNRFICDKTGRELELESSFPQRAHLVAKFKGIDSCEQAQALGQSYLLIPIDQAAPLPPGRFYYFQLVGLDVYQDEELLGSLTEVLPYTANDIYLIKTPQGGEILLPALKSVIKTVDLEQGRMEVILPPGLLD